MMAAAITSSHNRPTPTICRIPISLVPIVAGSIWLLMLVSLIATWISDGSPHYSEMFPTQHLAYISNTGATYWGQPIFAVGSTITAVLFSTIFASEKWLQYRDVLVSSSSKRCVALSIAAAFFTLAGSCSLILLTLFNVRQHPLIHYSNVGVFLLGYILAASCACAEKGYLSRRHPTNINLRRSFWMKFIFIASEIIIGVVFVVTMYEKLYSASVVAEWVIGMLFAFYLSALSIDFFCLAEDTRKDEERGGDMEKRIYVKVVDWDEECLIAAPSRVRMASSASPEK